ncbi:Zinc/iron permease [Syncephalis plumigaleata]|nr:Zinc/iron permease [Syncephalis plumigaleata]
MLLLLVANGQASNVPVLVRRHGNHGHSHGGHSHASAEAEEGHAHGASGECGARLDLDNYNEPLHIASIFIILAASAVGVFGALIAGRVKRLNVHEHVLNTFKHFGTGVILATGFVHMLPEAIEALSDECLSSFNANFSTWGPFFTMVAVLVLQLIEFMAGSDATPTTVVDNAAAVQETSHVDGHQHANDELHDHHGHQHAHNHADGRGHACHDVAMLLDKDAQLRISTYILELGIALHSILIGITLGVTSVAIVFHQFFEGVALGSRIAEITSSKQHGDGGKMAYILASIFALITPIGMAIGMGIRTSYSPRSPSALLIRGIFDAFSAGVLIYMALVNLIAEEFTNCRKFHQRTWRIKVLYFASLYLGTAAMSVIGTWA